MKLKSITAVALTMALLGGVSPAMDMNMDKFFDSEDGYFDMSEFLDDPAGFIPLVIPITEPAVGFGAVFAPVFIRSNDTEHGEKHKPNIFGAGGLATENGSKGLFGFHSGSWFEDNLHTTVFGYDMSMNLDFYGVGVPNANGDRALSYNMEATGLSAEGMARIRESAWWLGAGYSYSDVNASYRGGASLGGFTPPSLRTNIGTLSMLARYDVLNNFFTPTGGYRWDLKLNISDPALGADGSWQSAELKGVHYWALDAQKRWIFGMKARGDAAFDDPPFYLNPFVQLRGIPAMRYQGHSVAELEGELRYQFHPRFSVLAFAGGGMAWRDTLTGSAREEVVAGGLGFRYLLAKQHGLHMGVDLGYSEDNGTAIYIQFGSAWASF